MIRTGKIAAILAVAALTIGLPGTAGAPVYLKLGDIKGESTDDKHKDWINLLSVSGSADTRQARQVTLTQDMSARSDSDSDRPRRAALAPRAARMKHVDRATLIVRKAGGDATSRPLRRAARQQRPIPDAVIEAVAPGETEPYMIIKMKNVMVSSYQTGGASGDTVPMEDFALNYGKITVEYEPAQQGESTDEEQEVQFKIQIGTSD